MWPTTSFSTKPGRILHFVLVRNTLFFGDFDHTCVFSIIRTQILHEFRAVQNQYVMCIGVSMTLMRKLAFLGGTSLYEHLRSYFQTQPSLELQNYELQKPKLLWYQNLKSFSMSRFTFSLQNVISVLENVARTRSKMTT